MKNLLSIVGMVQRMGITGGVMRPDLSLPMVAIKAIANRGT